MSFLFRRPPTIALITLALSLAFATIYFLYHWNTSIKTPPSEAKKINISCFIYRDVNRDGQYDMSDRPYAGLPIKLTRPQGDIVSTRSNISGFANFKMSSNNAQEAIDLPGEYTVQAKPVSNWEISSNNAEQSLVFERLEQSPAGIILTNTCDPIGIKPVLQITGDIALDNFDQDNSVLSFTSVSPDGREADIIIDDAGHYRFPATRGSWKLVLISHKNTLTRMVVVDQSAVRVAKLRLTAPAENTGPVISNTVGFDDLSTSDTLYEVPNGYGKLNWTNWIATHQKFYKGYGYINGTVSSEFMAYNSSGHPASVWSTIPFNFQGVNITVAWPDGELADIIIQAWRGDELIYEDRFSARTSGPTYFDANYTNITKLKFSTETYWQLIIDDFHYQLKAD